jgi:hypothetical protein
MKTQMLKIIKTATVMALPLLAALTPARGQVIYRADFEAPTFVADLPLAGQDGWIAPPPFSPNAAVITTNKSHRGEQTVRVLGADLVHQDFLGPLTGGYYDALGSYRHNVDYDTGGTKAVMVSARVRIDGPRTPKGTNFFSASIATRTTLTDGSTAGTGELALSSDGNAYGYSGNENAPTLLAHTRAKLGEWHELTVVVDFASHTYSFFVDDDYLGSFAFDTNNGPGVDYTTVFKRGSLLAYAGPDTATLKKADYSAHYDHFVIAADGDSEDQDQERE